jgi:thiol-disulfide isomerase/thioredoxin
MNSLQNRVIGIMDSRINSQMVGISLVAAIAVLIFTCTSLHAETGMDRQTPAFELADSDDQLLRYPGDLDGTTIVLFWASWCPYCKALMPHLQSIIDEYEGEIEVLALNFRDDEDPGEYISERGFDFRLFPKGDPVAELWGVKGTPGLFLVDKTGLVIFTNYAIPENEYPRDATETTVQMKHYQKAARKAPFWAARLRLAIDKAGL